MSNTIHHFCISQTLPLPAAFPRFCRNKTKTLLYSVLYTEEDKVTGHLKTTSLYCAESAEVPYTERIRWLHDRSHKVPALTISLISAKSSVHSFTDTHTLTRILLPTVAQQHFPHPVPQTQIK